MTVLPDDADEDFELTGEDTPGVEPDAKPPLITLSKLRPVAIRDVWPTEPHHFTPWLLANADYLSEVLGLDVELDAREHRIGPFSLDLVGREVNTENRVIVENQFGPTDHIHLGQLLTYAGGTDPHTIVWIAEDFRDQHRAALSWLNEHTAEGIRFFGVRLGAVTIDGSAERLVAPFLELVVQPNDYVKGREKGPGPNDNNGGNASAYTEFWAGLAPELRSRGWTQAQGTKDNWWSMTAGYPGVRWSVSFAQFGCRSDLYFGNPDAAQNTALFEALVEHRAEFEATYGPGHLNFDPLPKRKGCRVEARLDGPKINDRDRWPEVYAWMLDTQERMRAALASVGGMASIVTEADTRMDPV